MKIQHPSKAQETIQSYVNNAQQAGQAAQVGGDAHAAELTNLARQLIGGQPDPILIQPPVMRYGIIPIKPPVTDQDGGNTGGPPITAKYGIILPDNPDTPDPIKPPIAMRYGIIPPPDVGQKDK